MLLLNPNNSNDSAWAHAVPETLDLRPDHSGDIDDDYLDALSQALDYDSFYFLLFFIIEPILISETILKTSMKRTSVASAMGMYVS